MVKNIKNLFLMVLLISVYLYSAGVNAAVITATVDRNPIPVGESFRFILDVRGSVSKEPDFTELQKQFTILSQSQSSNFRYINGAITRNKTWTLMLISEKTGPKTIPAIKVGSDSSEEIKVNIIATSVNTQAAKSREIYLEIELDPKEVYVQQQIIYTVKLFRTIHIANATLSDPVIENDQAIISKIGKDRNYNSSINGVSYTVFERRYAIFPQKSGVLKIAPITFETEIVRGSRSFFNATPFAQNNVKRIRSKSITIDVKGVPAEFSKKYPKSSWLPVNKLSIDESWSTDTDSLKVGEPVTRTIRLSAQNLSAAQLPTINFDTSSDIKNYPDKAEAVENENKFGLVSAKEFKTALLPTKSGQYKLSEISIPWWNTRSDKLEVVTISEKMINVTATAVLNENNNNQNISQAKETITNNTEQLSSKDSTDNTIQSSPLLWIITSIVFAFLWLSTLFLFLRATSKKSNAEPFNNSSTVKKVSKRAIKTACIENNARAASQAILNWANANTDQIQFDNLSALSPYLNARLVDSLQNLQYSLYSNTKSNWLGKSLWAAFKSEPPILSLDTKARLETPKLAPLYAK